MKYAILGKGKTGSAVIKLLPQEDIVSVFDSQNRPTVDKLQAADVVITFISAHALEQSLTVLLESKRPVICGTTGYHWPKHINETLIKTHTTWIHANNFSLGMNLLLQLTQTLKNQLTHLSPSPHITITDIHHKDKKDAPSGSALTLQEKLTPIESNIVSHREQDVKGTHSLSLELPNETLTLTHEALDRSIFAQGALFAARSLLPNCPPGLHAFSELINKQNLEKIYY